MKSKLINKILGVFGVGKTSAEEPENLKNIFEDEEFEPCVMCGESTGVPSSMPVDWRENYELGLGQLCLDCARKRQEAIERENMLTRQK